MTRVRPQYHLRPSPRGLLAWDVRRLIELSKPLPVQQIRPAEIKEFDENHRYFQAGVEPTCRSVVEHVRFIESCDLSHPIILDENGSVMNGMHRVCKAVLEKVATIPAVRFDADPEPDFVDCAPASLPYTD